MWPFDLFYTVEFWKIMYFVTMAAGCAFFIIFESDILMPEFMKDYKECYKPILSKKKKKIIEWLKSDSIWLHISMYKHHEKKYELENWK